MSDLRKWRVTGPDGFKTSITSLAHEDAEHVAVEATRSVALTKIVRQAGYRAEPIEEPKMVSVRFDDLSAVMEMAKFAVTNPFSDLDPYDRLRAALAAQEGEK